MNRLKKCTLLLLFLMIHLFHTPLLYGNVGYNRKPHITFLISKDTNNYEADRTIPLFSRMLAEKHGYTTSVLQSKGYRTASCFPGLKEELEKADLLVIFARRLAIPTQELASIKDYLKKGRPVIGIRTANHAFSVPESDLKESGYESWWEFVPDVLGCLNKGYGPVESGTHIAVNSAFKKHPVLKGIPKQWHSKGNLYLVDFSIDPQSVPLLYGSTDHLTHPVAWIRMAGKSKVFYTSLGHPSDFDALPFKTLILNAIKWALQQYKRFDKMPGL